MRAALLRASAPPAGIKLTTSSRPTWVNDLPVGTVDQGELDKVLGNWGRTIEIAAPASAASASSLPLAQVRLSAAKAATALAKDGDAAFPKRRLSLSIPAKVADDLENAIFSDSRDWLRR